MGKSVSLSDTDFLSVDDVYAGEDIVEDVLSGRHTFKILASEPSIEYRFRDLVSDDITATRPLSP